MVFALIGVNCLALTFLNSAAFKTYPVNTHMLLDRIELFVRVAAHGNIAKAARELHVSPSSVTQRLKSLEKDFGVKLYVAHRTGIEVTPAGEQLLSAASQVLQRIKSLREVQGRRRGPGKTS